MFKVAVKTVLGHKVRVLLTALAVVAGVAFMAGTFVLTDTIKKGFDDLFTDANEGIDAVVRQKAAFEVNSGDSFSSDQRDDVSLDLLPTIEKVDGVASADASITGFAFIIDKDGDPLNPPGQAPQFGSNWPSSPDMNPYVLREGKAPTGPGQAVIDHGSAEKGDIGVGDRIKVQVQGAPLELTVSGIASFGESDNQLGASFVLMDLDDAAKAFGQQGKASQLQVHAEQGVSQQQLVDNLTPALPKDVEAVTGDQATQESQDDIEEGFNQFNIVLSGFAFVALVAGAFLIYNIFGIVVAERTRELAMLRALGASRQQVRRSVLVEAFITGAVGSLVGLLGGIGLAFLLVSALKAIGLDLPSTVPIVAPRTVILSLVVGLVVTMVSAFLPARRASRVLPLAAIREVALETGKRSPVRWIIGGLFLLVGAIAVVSGVSGTSPGPILLGILLLFVGVVVVGPRIAGPIANVLGAGAPRVAGLTGTLARQNAVRNPRRTSATAAAIVLTLMLVSTITIFFTSFTASINASVVKGLKADLEVASESFGFGGLSPDLASQLQDLPEVGEVAELRTGFAQVEGETKGQFVWGTNGPQFGKLLDVGVETGSMDDLTGKDTVALSTDESEASNKPVGSTVTMQFPDGHTGSFEVVATFSEEGLIGQGASAVYLLSLEAFEANQPAQVQNDQRVLVKGSDGTSMSDLRAAVDRVANDFPTSKVQDVEEIQKSQTKFFTQVLGFVLVLLALSVLIGFLGIAITLALSVIERTRELGLLRAVGMNRLQVWLMVSAESVLIAMLGTVLGIALGLIGGIALATTFRADIDTAKINVPIVVLLVFCVVSAIFGLIASVFPAWRASRLNVLEAVSDE